MRRSKPPFDFGTPPCAQSAAVDRIEVVSVGTLPKMTSMSS